MKINLPETEQMQSNTHLAYCFLIQIGALVDQQNRALEAATVTLRYSTALCPPMGKTREIFDLHFLAKPEFFRANYCDVTK